MFKENDKIKSKNKVEKKKQKKTSSSSMLYTNVQQMYNICIYDDDDDDFIENYTGIEFAFDSVELVMRLFTHQQNIYIKFS